MSPSLDKLPISEITTLAKTPKATFQPPQQEVIYIESASELGDVVYIPQTAVFDQHCRCPPNPSIIVPLPPNESVYTSVSCTMQAFMIDTCVLEAT